MRDECVRVCQTRGGWLNLGGRNYPPGYKPANVIGNIMRTSQSGIDLIKRFEGLELESYQDITGIWTIGYGHTGPEVGPDQRITTSEAEALLRHDLVSREKAVSRLTKVDINQNEFDALVSFVYNVGETAYSRSTARRRLNAENRIGAADALTWFNKATVNGVLREVLGLTRRRASEKALFLTPVAMLPSRPENVNESGRVTPVEDPPRRGAIGESRTLQGAAVAGGAGAVATTMGRDASEELDDLETQIENGEGMSIDPPQGENDNSDDGATDNGGATDTPDTDNQTGDTDTGDSTSEPDDGSIELEGLPPLDGGHTHDGTEHPANRPAAHDKHDMDAQIQLALMVVIILAILYIIYARIDDWFRYRR